VIASQRGRLLDAIVGVVSDKGYAATTVTDIVDRAAVSRRTFYEQFPDKEACFLAAYDTGVELLLAHMRDAVAALDGDWRTSARASIEAYLEILASEPEFAWALHVEVLGAGPAALERRAAIIALLGQQWRRLHQRGRREEPGLPDPPDEVLRTIVVGHEELARECLRTHGAQALPQLVRPALEVALAILDRHPD
jgi:AcrR family transcriptional regulator